MLSRLAQEFAAEIAQHDWSDAPYRLDRAGHQRASDSKSRASDETLSSTETESVLTNVMWVTAQVLAHRDPNFDVHEYAAACGVPPRIRLRNNGAPSGAMTAGLRFQVDGRIAPPGQ